MSELSPREQTIRECQRQIRRIQEEAQRAMQPYLDTITDLRAREPLPPVVMDAADVSAVIKYTHCAHEFKGAVCGYSGLTAVCNKTFADCFSKANEHNFGGYPEIKDG